MNSNHDKVTSKEMILNVLEHDFSGISTTNELAEAVELSWNTAEKYLLELTLEGKILRMKKTGVNLWIIKDSKNNEGVVKIEP